MKKRIFNRRTIWFITILFLVCLYGVFVKKLEGYHLITNINNPSTNVFYITPKTTGKYTFRCKSSFRNIEYTVYEIGTNLLIEKDTFGQEVEGYYPFIHMKLNKGNRYKVQIRVLDENKFGTLHIKLKSIK